jgi:rhomboid protease GluP
LYFFSGITGNLVSMGWDFYLEDFIPSIGASGAVFGVTGAVVVIAWFGRKRLRFEGSDLMKRLLIYIVISLSSGFNEVNIDNAAHVGGLLGGMLITLLMTIILKKEYTMEEWI